MKKEIENIIATNRADTHLGYNSKRLREILGIKQETLALKMGISQTKLSRLESKENLSDHILSQLAEAMGIDKEVIKNFKEGMISFRDFIAQDTSTAIVYQTINNPVEKICELYERLLEAEKAKNEILSKNQENKE